MEKEIIRVYFCFSLNNNEMGSRDWLPIFYASKRFLCLYTVVRLMLHALIMHSVKRSDKFIFIVLFDLLHNLKKCVIANQ